MIGRALTDRRFREALLRSPRRATRGLPLTRAERKAIVSVRAASLEDYSRKVIETLPESRELQHFDAAGGPQVLRPRAVEGTPQAARDNPEGALFLRRQASRSHRGKLTLGLASFSARLILRVLGALLALGTLTTVVARANQAVAPSGEGVGAASGYLVSGIEYRLSVEDPSRLASVTFGLTSVRGSRAPGQVSVSVDGGVDWTPCFNVAGSRWSCRARTSVRQVSSLRVVAAQ